MVSSVNWRAFFFAALKEDVLPLCVSQSRIAGNLASLFHSTLESQIKKDAKNELEYFWSTEKYILSFFLLGHCSDSRSRRHDLIWLVLSSYY